MKILLLEDVKASRDALVEIIQTIEEQIEVIAIASETEAMAALQKEQGFDLFLLDINLEEKKPADTSGMRVAEAIRRMHCYEFTPLVFITSILSLELTSYRELSCYRYITKPFDEQEVRTIIEKVMQHSEEKDKEKEVSIIVKKDGVNYKILCQDIVYIEAIPRGLRLVMKEEQLEVRYLTLKQLLPKLPPEDFIQCHRMYIVNRHYIDYVDTVNRWIKLKNCETPVEIGVTYKTQIRSFLHE